LRNNGTQVQGRILGLDYGEKRIGIAVSDPLNIIARSLGVIPNDADAIKTVGNYVRQYAVSLIVIGMPYTLKGETSRKGNEVLVFARTLQEAVGVKVEMVDERFTSRIARQTMLMMGTTKKQRRQKHRVDEMASALILQSYLDQRK